LDSLPIGNFQLLGEMVIIVMLKQQIMNILLNLIVIGQVFKVERHALSFATEIWKNTVPPAVVKLGSINMLPKLLKPIVPCTFRKDLD